MLAINSKTFKMTINHRVVAINHIYGDIYCTHLALSFAELLN